MKGLPLVDTCTFITDLRIPYLAQNNCATNSRCCPFVKGAVVVAEQEELAGQMRKRLEDLELNENMYKRKL